MISDYLFLPAVILIGVITSWQDFQTGKIKNFWIMAGLLWGAFAYILVFICGYLFSIPHALHLGTVAVNSGLALLIGYLMWHLDWWAAGDAKLFFIFAFLLPFKYYWKNFLPFFPSIDILINTFISVLAFILICDFLYFLKRAIEFIGAKKLNKRLIEREFVWRFQNFKINFVSYLKTGYEFMVIFLMIRVLKALALKYANFKIKDFVVYVSAMLLMEYLGKLTQKKIILAGSSLLLGAYFLAEIFYFGGFQNAGGIFSQAAKIVFYLVLFALAHWAHSFYQKNHPEKEKIHFAFWLFLGVILTIVLKGSLFLVFLH